MVLLWKEVRQQRWFWVGGGLCGLVPPACELVEECLRGGDRELRTMSGGPTVLCAGALFAVALAVATTQADVAGRRPDFWQSRPLSPFRLLATKLLVAAAGLLGVFALVAGPDVLSEALTRGQLAVTALVTVAVAYPVAVMLFAATMLLTALTRDAARAGLLAVWAALLTYFLPLVVGGLGWLNVFDQIDRLTRLPPLPLHSVIASFGVGLAGFLPDPGPYLGLLSVTGTITLACGAAAVLALERGWQWHPGQRTIVWTLGLSAAVLFVASMRQVGHDLQPAREHRGRALHSRGLAMLPRTCLREDWTRAEPSPELAGLRLVAARGAIGYQIAGHVRTEDRLRDPYQAPRAGWTLCARNLVVAAGVTPPAFAACFCSIAKPQYGHDPEPDACLDGDRLFVVYHACTGGRDSSGAAVAACGLRLLALDVREPLRPRPLEETPLLPEPGGGGGRIGLVTSGERLYVAHAGRLLAVSLTVPGVPRILGDVATECPLPSAAAGELAVRVTSPVGAGPLRLSVGDGFLAMAGSRLVCGVDHRLMVFDAATPGLPVLLADVLLAGLPPGNDGRIRAGTGDGDTVYLATRAGVSVVALRSGPGGGCAAAVVGERRATPLERLAGRYPMALLGQRGLLVEAAGAFGVLVYDLADSRRPRRAWHAPTAGFAREVATWDELLCVRDTGAGLTFYELPTPRP